MPGLDWSALAATKLVRDPFDYAHTPQALTPETAASVSQSFPEITRPGSYSLRDVKIGPVLQSLIEDLQSERFREAMANLFQMDLGTRPCLITLRGQVAARDGRIHTDSKTKLLSLLLYLNDGWTTNDAQLRMLKNNHDVNAFAFEVPPTMGSLVGFRRTDNSWHGHTRFVGQRRALQLNYLVSKKDNFVSRMRHGVSAVTKRWAKGNQARP